MTSINNISFTQSSHKPQGYRKIVFYLLIALIGLSASLFVSAVISTTAYAGVGIGGGDETPPTPPDPNNPNPPNPTPPSSQKTTEIKPTNSASFSLICSNWGGSGSWKLSASCNTTTSAIKNANPLEPKEGYKTRGGQGPIGFTSGLANTACGPNGNISAYKQKWSSRVEAATEYQWLVYPDGRWEAGPEAPTLMGYNVYYSFQGCNYPVEERQYTRCYWNNQGNISYSINRSANIGNWNVYYTRPAQAGDPKAPTGGSGNAAPSGRCTGGSGVSNYVSVNADVHKYGYYSAVYSFNSRLYTHIQYVADGKIWYKPGWSGGGIQNHTNRNFFTYSCITNGNAIKGPYNSQAATPNVDPYLNPATCRQVSWQCKLGTPTTIGLDRAAVLNGSVNPNSKATVMRNGQKVNIDFANVRIVDTSTSRDIDITDGGSSPGVRNITNIGYQTKVAPGSTPFYGDNSSPKTGNTNTTQQYFKYFANRSNSTIEKFYTWLPNNNANQNKAISFNWASDASAPFKVTREYNVSGQFLTPGGASVGTGGAVNTGYIWKDGTYSCREYSGRGSGRVDIGPLVSTSNPVEVVRSVNQ